MSAAQLPYHVRPHKTVDRRLFLDLLSRYERWRPLANFAYVSMGGYPLEDHKQIHRYFGIEKLISFDGDENTVRRQCFNRPVSSCFCFKRRSSEVVDDFEKLLKDGNADDASGVIVWLDYTAPAQLGEQIREFQTLLDQLKSNDIVRVTINANPSSLGNDQASDGTRLTKPDLHKKRFTKLQQRIGEYLPSDATAADVAEENYSGLLAKALGTAASNALPSVGSRTFTPLSIVRYADGQPMLSVTGAIIDRDLVLRMRSQIAIEDWPFGVDDWTVNKLKVPALTFRERMFLDREVVTADPDVIAEGLGFEIDENYSTQEFLSDYIKYYRFYPALFAADI